MARRKKPDTKSDLSIKADDAETISIGNVESMTNHIQNVEQINHHHYDKPPRPVHKIRPLSEEEGGLSLAQRKYFRETIDKVCELGKIVKNPKAVHAIVRASVNREGGVDTVGLYPAAMYWAGVIKLEEWLSPMLVHEKVMAKPPEWWRGHLKQAVHIHLARNGTEEAFRVWLGIRFNAESMDELSDPDLVECYKARRNKFANPKEKVHPRDHENRLMALESFLDEAESEGRFNRMNIPLERKELLAELQATNRQLFSISESTFETFLKQAKKTMSFGFKRGVRAQARTAKAK
jgi:hypothetical protein